MDVRIVAQTEREKPRNVPTVDIVKLRTSSMPDILGLKDEVNVYHVGRDGVEVVPSRYNRNNNTIEFDANSFSTYVIAYKDVAKVPQTADSTSVAVWMMLLAVGGCAITLASKLKKQYKSKLKGAVVSWCLRQLFLSFLSIPSRKYHKFCLLFL